MKNTIIAILVIVLLVLGFLFFTQKKTNVSYEPWPETEPATVRPTTNNQTSSNNNSTQQNPKMRTYNASGFSFKYDSSATVRTGTNAGQTLYFVEKEGEVTEVIKLVNTSELDPAEGCGDIEKLTTIMNGKNFRYCNSNAEPATTYFYTEGSKTLVVMTQGARMGLYYSYIDPGSVDIN